MRHEMERRVQIHKEIAASVIKASKIEERAHTGKRRATVLGSNYLAFQKKEPNKVSFAEPTENDRSTFRISLEAWKILREMGIETTVAIIPADFIKGADNQELAELRSRYIVPQSFQDMLLGEYGVPPSEYFVKLESSYKRKALDILRRRILNGKAGIQTHEIETDNRTTIMARIRDLQYVEIPIGRRIEGERESNITIPLCQTILTTIYHRLVEAKQTDFFGIVRDDERVCVKQGTVLAKKMEILKLSATIVAIKVHEDDQLGMSKMEVVGLDNYSGSE
jgi:hypothetical protein